jgi:hypothetical protein
MECHECGASISDKAADCPRCGASVRDLSGGTEAETPEDAAHAGDAEGETDATSTDPETDIDSNEHETDTGSENTTSDINSGGAVGSDEGRNDPVVPGGESGPESTDAESGEYTTETEHAETTIGTGDEETETGWEAAGPPPSEQDDRRDAPGSPADDEETGWEAAGPPPEDQEPGVQGEPAVGNEESAVGDQETVIGGDESAVGGDEPTVGEDDPAVGDGSEFGGGETSVDAETGFGRETETGGAEPEIPDETGGTGAAGAGAGVEREGGPESPETVDPAAGIRDLPFLSGPIAGLVTAAVLAVLSVVVAALVEGTGLDTASLGGLVFLDIHFATGFHVTPGLFERFDVADPPASALGLLYLLPLLFCYTAAKFVAAYNVDETTPLPLAGAAGALVAVGYFPVVLVAFVLAPSDPQWEVSLLATVLLAGFAYPVCFGFLGGLAAGAFSSSERRVGTLYGVVSFFLLTIGAVVVTVVALEPGDVGLLPQVHASLFTIVAANGFSLGGPETGALVFLGYPLVAGVVFAAGFLRAWNANDIEEPLRGAAKGLSPVATYFVLLGVVATLLPVLADPWVVRELGFTFTETTLVQSLVDLNLPTIGRYITVVLVGTLFYAVFLGGLGGTVAGAVRYGLSDDN